MERKTFVEALDAAETGEEFGEVLSNMMNLLAEQAHDYVWEGDE